MSYDTHLHNLISAYSAHRPRQDPRHSSTRRPIEVTPLVCIRARSQNDRRSPHPQKCDRRAATRSRSSIAVVPSPYWDGRMPALDASPRGSIILDAIDSLRRGEPGWEWPADNVRAASHRASSPSRIRGRHLSLCRLVTVRSTGQGRWVQGYASRVESVLGEPRWNRVADPRTTAAIAIMGIHPVSVGLLWPTQGNRPWGWCLRRAHWGCASRPRRGEPNLQLALQNDAFPGLEELEAPQR